MNNLESRIAYLRGLADGMDFSSTKEKRFNIELIEVLSEIARSVDEIEEISYETQEYLENLDEDLGELEEDFYDDNDCHCDVNDLDKDNCYYENFEEENYEDDDFLETKCLNCNEIVYIDKSLLSNEGKVECPNCRASISLD